MIDVQFQSFREMRGYGTTRFRCEQPAAFLSSAGFDARASSLDEANVAHARLIVLHRLRLDGLVSSVIELARRRGAVIAYDIDDFVTDDPQPYDLSPAIVDVLRRVDVVTVSGSYLKEVIDSVHVDCRIMRNKLSQQVLDMGASAMASRLSIPGLATVGYFSGSAHHDADFQLVTPQILRLMEERPGVSLLVAGKIEVDSVFAKFGARFRFEPFRPYDEFMRLLGEIDINLAPLDLTSRFACARSELKYIEGAAFGVPTLASPTPAFCEAIKAGRTGFLCHGNEWLEVLLELVDNPELRTSVGLAARRHVEKEYSPEAGQAEWTDLYMELCSRPTSKAGSLDRFSAVGRVLAQAQWKAIRRKARRLMQ